MILTEKELVNILEGYSDLQIEITENGFSITYVPTNEYIGFYRKGVYYPVMIHQMEYQRTLSPIFKKQGIKVVID